MDPLVLLLKRANIADPKGDKNVGKARETNGSLSSFLSTLTVSLIIFAALTLIFIILRRTNRRIYAPRTYVGTVEKWRRLHSQDDDSDGYADEVEGVSGFSGILGWVNSVWKIPDETVLRTNGLDGFFFLRYLRKAQMVCFVGCLLTWVILLPLNITGGVGQKGLDKMSFSNISDKNKNRLYGHVFVGWIFFGFILFTVYRELVFFTTTRQAYMLSPIYSTRISARTVLVQTIPNEYLNESALKRMFDHVKRVWIPTDTTKLDELIKERNKIVLKLEAAEVKLIRLADKARTKAGGAVDSKVDPDSESAGESGSVAGQWLPRKNRPTHRLKPMFGEKVDTIDWCRGKLAELKPQIEELQAAERAGDGIRLNSAFIEFTTQSAAQTAAQVVAHHKPLHMAPRYIGITPEEIIWSNMKLQWYERLVKFATTTAFVVAMVIFWSIPVAIVGALSNIKNLTEKLPFLKFINDIPEAILGVVTGLLPAVMLAVLMALVPIVLRLMGRISGLPSLSLIELRVQNSYFLFQVIQVFLVTTMTSAASSVVPQIINNPSSVTGLLAENVPKASNFYIAFMILQGLAISAGALVQIAGLILYKLLGWFLDNTPRKKFNRWASLSGLGWGTVFPVSTNICVIAITYSIIAPLVLGFATIGLGLLYFAYRYNLLFVYNVNIDTKGLVYPRALFQTLTGVYLAEICLIGLFGVRKAFGPMILQIIFLVFTILFQMTISNAIQPLLEFLPKNLQIEEEALESLESGHAPTSSGAVTDSVLPIDADGDGKPGVSAENVKPNAFARFLHPEKYESYQHMRKRIPQNWPEVHYTPDFERDAYYNPSITAVSPAIWLPRDAGGVSRQEVAHTSAVNPISDQGAIINNAGKVERQEDAYPPDWKEKPLW